ncbi:MAG TPA: 2-dehydro-3-deoxygalactonokinase [Geminicoccaceae bacterium]|nr:2-dehydro-3-deoxygalactonokinase [Geminicoccus sp.]HMU48313.1 2-dehydro-3-deoxygalactonokinase [Geminicoccaceae bacterium]
MDAALIGLDWGTSSFRGYRMAADGTVLERREAPAGILQVVDRDFDAAFVRLVGDWVGAGAPVLASGMIGSRQGWVEAPYAPCPAGAEDIVGHLVRHRTRGGAELRFVPGLSFRGADGVPDVMRGEETQILGVLAQRPEARLLVLPGTHSKWALVEQGRVVWFASFMTGELFAVLRQHSILGRLMQGDAADASAFARGVRFGLSGDPGAGGLLRRLFSARTLGLFDEVPGTGIADYLSGLLLGCELREAFGCAGRPAVETGVLIVGGAALAARYRTALEIAGVGSEAHAGEAAATGQWVVARAAGLIGG